VADRSTVSTPGYPWGGHPAGDPATEAGRHPAAAVQPFDVSATLTGFDGTVMGSVTRHRGAGSADPPPSARLIVIGVTGDVDADTSPLLHTALTEALDVHHRVCCDLSSVTFFGAAGADTLLAAQRHATAAGRHFTVRGAQGIIRLVLDITRLDRLLAVTE
jgi:anti-anti-sigma factor